MYFKRKKTGMFKRKKENVDRHGPWPLLNGRVRRSFSLSQAFFSLCSHASETLPIWRKIKAKWTNRSETIIKEDAKWKIEEVKKAKRKELSKNYNSSKSLKVIFKWLSFFRTYTVCEKEIMCTFLLRSETAKIWSKIAKQFIIFISLLVEAKRSEKREFYFACKQNR